MNNLCGALNEGAQAVVLEGPSIRSTVGRITVLFLSFPGHELTMMRVGIATLYSYCIGLQSTVERKEGSSLFPVTRFMIISSECLVL